MVIFLCRAAEHADRKLSEQVANISDELGLHALHRTSATGRRPRHPAACQGEENWCVQQEQSGRVWASAMRDDSVAPTKSQTFNILLHREPRHITLTNKVWQYADDLKGTGSERFVVLKVASMKTEVSWVHTPCSLVDVYHCFRGTCCFNHQGYENMKYASNFKVTKMEAVYSSKMLVPSWTYLVDLLS